MPHRTKKEYRDFDFDRVGIWWECTRRRKEYQTDYLAWIKRSGNSRIKKAYEIVNKYGIRPIDPNINFFNKRKNKPLSSDVACNFGKYGHDQYIYFQILQWGRAVKYLHGKRVYSFSELLSVEDLEEGFNFEKKKFAKIQVDLNASTERIKFEFNRLISLLKNKKNSRKTRKATSYRKPNLRIFNIYDEFKDDRKVIDKIARKYFSDEFKRNPYEVRRKIKKENEMCKKLIKEEFKRLR